MESTPSASSVSARSASFDPRPNASTAASNGKPASAACTVAFGVHATAMNRRSLMLNEPPFAAKNAHTHRAARPAASVRIPNNATSALRRLASTAAPIKPNSRGSPTLAQIAFRSKPVSFAGLGPQVCAAAVLMTSESNAAPPENSQRAPAKSASCTSAISATARAADEYPSAVSRTRGFEDSVVGSVVFTAKAPPSRRVGGAFVAFADGDGPVASSSGGRTVPRSFPTTTPPSAPPTICVGACHAAAAAPPAPMPGSQEDATPNPAMAYTTSTEAAVMASAGTPALTPRPWSCSASIEGTTTAGEMPAKRYPSAAQCDHGKPSAGLASRVTTSASAVAGPNASRLMAHRRRYTALTSRDRPARASTMPSAAVRAAAEKRASTAAPTASPTVGMLRSRKPATSWPRSAGMGGKRATTRPAPKEEKSTTNTANTAPPGPNEGPTARRPAAHHASRPATAIPSRRASRAWRAVSSGDHIENPTSRRRHS
mmetsp:Transcript_2808/g.11628  ORF Transcript_2808/g.11628 Transcript_2808/m.11628 type:complete len:487 (-) Transcript_2808:37-1497(-)